MGEKNVWKVLFFTMLLICVVLFYFLVKDGTEINYKDKYQNLKQSYIEVARTQSGILSEMMLKPDVLKANNPAYKNLSDDELNKKVRKDIGRLEVKLEELEKEKLR